MTFYTDGFPGRVTLHPGTLWAALEDVVGFMRCGDGGDNYAGDRKEQATSCDCHGGPFSLAGESSLGTNPNSIITA